MTNVPYSISYRRIIVLYNREYRCEPKIRTTEEDGLLVWSGPKRYIESDTDTIEREGNIHENTF